MGADTNRQFTNTIASEVGRNSTGRGGRITLVGRRLRLNERSVISTQTAGSGAGGNLTLRIRDGITLNRQSVIRSSVTSGGTGRGGNLTIQTGLLSASRGSAIGAGVLRSLSDSSGNTIPAGRGNSGNVRIRATNVITLNGISPTGFSSSIFSLAERGTEGKAGDIRITTGRLQITNGANVIASTANHNRGGDVVVHANELNVANGGQIITTTLNRGRAGAIRLNTTGDVTLAGVDPNFENRQDRIRRYLRRPNQSDRFNDVLNNQSAASGLFANTTGRSQGRGGTITVNAANLTLTDGAAISAQSRGRGQAGNLNLRVADRLNLNNSTLITSANRSNGGEIGVNARAIALNDNGDIRTDVAQGANSGGNITLTADSILAFDDSDILAFARQGQGGNVILNTPIFFGENYEPAPPGTQPGTLDGNNRVDVNASGQLRSGTIQLPDESFIQNSLSNLPETVIDTDRLIANSCIARTASGSTFLVTGSGGLPPGPGVAPLSPYPAGTVRTEPNEPSTSSSWKPGDAIVEPQGVYQLPNGELIMSRECDHVRAGN
jgi:large exoprotein involved in heme utilization and adhesion